MGLMKAEVEERPGGHQYCSLDVRSLSGSTQEMERDAWTLFLWASWYGTVGQEMPVQQCPCFAFLLWLRGLDSCPKGPCTRPCTSTVSECCQARHNKAMVPYLIELIVITPLDPKKASI